MDAGEPAILLGTDTGPNPAESLLHALAACLTTSLVYVAAARGVHLTEVESTLEGDMDVQGALGLVGRLPQRLRADPRLVPRQGRRARGEAARGRRSARSSARPSSTWSPTASRSRWTWRPRDPRRSRLVVRAVRRGEPIPTGRHHRSFTRGDEHACERRRVRHVPTRRQAVGHDRHRLRVGLRRSADGPRLAGLRRGRRRARSQLRDGSASASSRRISSRSPRYGSAPRRDEVPRAVRRARTTGEARARSSPARSPTSTASSPSAFGSPITPSSSAAFERHAPHDGTPLIYHRRAYRTLAEPARARPPTGRSVRCPSN